MSAKIIMSIDDFIEAAREAASTKSGKVLEVVRVFGTETGQVVFSVSGLKGLVEIRPAPVGKDAAAETRVLQRCDEIEVGTVVELRSGGPAMTVVANQHSGGVECMWIPDGEGQMVAVVPVAALRKLRG